MGLRVGGGRHGGTLLFAIVAAAAACLALLGPPAAEAAAAATTDTTTATAVCNVTRALNVTELAAACPEQLSITHAILTSVPASIVKAMLNCTGAACNTAARTVFLPTDQAWRDYFGRYGASVASLTSSLAPDLAALRLLLRNHALWVRLAPGDLVAGAPAVESLTLAASDSSSVVMALEVRRLASGEVRVRGNYSVGRVLAEGIQLYLGETLAYTVDAVMATTPPPPSPPPSPPSPPPRPSPRPPRRPPRPPRPSPPPPRPPPRPPPPSPPPPRPSPPPPTPGWPGNITSCNLTGPSGCPARQFCVVVPTTKQPGCLPLTDQWANITLCDPGDPNACPSGQLCRSASVSLYYGKPNAWYWAQVPACVKPAGWYFNATRCDAGAEANACRPAGRCLSVDAELYYNGLVTGYEPGSYCFKYPTAYANMTNCTSGGNATCAPLGQDCQLVRLFLSATATRLASVTEYLCVPRPPYTTCSMYYYSPGLCYLGYFQLCVFPDSYMCSSPIWR